MAALGLRGKSLLALLLTCLLAFVFAGFIGREALYGRQWGTLVDRPFLHFELCYYQAIDFAIARGLSRVEAGAQGDHKIARGYLPRTTHSAHFIADPALRGPVADYLRREGPAVEAQRREMTEELSPFKKEN